MAVESINPVSEAYSLGGLKRVDRLRVESHGRNEGIVDDPGKEWARDDGVVTHLSTEAVALSEAFERKNADGESSSLPGEPSDAEAKEIQELRARDREVRAHEQAHVSAAGSLARGGATFSYTIGPDGRRYATGGEVSIDTSSVPGDPEATIRKMQQVRAAALAPAEPSGQDRQVAADATRAAASARAELSAEKAESPESSSDSPSSHVEGGDAQLGPSASPGTANGSPLDLHA